MKLVGTEQVGLFVLTEQEEVQVEAACLMVILEVGEGNGLFLEFFQRFRYELDVLFLLLAPEEDNALEKGVVIFFVEQPVGIRGNGSRKADAFPLQMVIEELAQVIIQRIVVAGSDRNHFLFCNRLKKGVAERDGKVLMVVLLDGLHAVEEGEREYRVVWLVLFAKPETGPGHVMDPYLHILVKPLVRAADHGLCYGAHLDDDLLALIEVQMNVVEQGQKYLIVPGVKHLQVLDVVHLVGVAVHKHLENHIVLIVADKVSHIGVHCLLERHGIFGRREQGIVQKDGGLFREIGLDVAVKGVIDYLYDADNQVNLEAVEDLPFGLGADKRKLDEEAFIVPAPFFYGLFQ